MYPSGTRGSQSNIVTRIIPDLKFTCDGVITQFTVGGRGRPGLQDPKIQVWRKCLNQPGTYFKPVPDIAVNATVCNTSADNNVMLSAGVFRCTLKDVFRVKVRTGDILGVELPPMDDQDFEVHFINTNEAPVNYVFQGQIVSAAVLADRESEVKDQPQINITLVPPGITTTTYYYHL